MALVSYGLKVGIRTNNPDFLDRIIQCLPPGWKLAESPVVQFLFSVRIAPPSNKPNIRNFHLLYGGTARRARTLDQEVLFESLENELQLFVAEYAKQRVFVHAGVVGWKGRAIVLPGRSFAGKSTLVAALLKAGATYYSDEYAVLDGRGRVYPYPRRLALRQQAGQPKRCQPEELGAVSGTKPLPIGLVALAKYRPGSCWTPQHLTPGAAALELINNTVPAQLKPEKVLAAINKFALRVPVLKGLRGEAREAASALLQELER